MTNKLKVAIITCYFDPDYVRSLTLRAALASMPNVELIVVKNKHRGMLRYPETIWKVFITRLRLRPDVYLLTFRGQEMLPFVLSLAWPKPVIFDEFLVPLAWATQERHKLTPAIALQKVLSRMLAWPYKLWLKQCKLILTDTDANADLSADLAKLPRSHYQPVPVGAEETMFTPKVEHTPNKTFEVFFCGNMRPLYGLQYVLGAAENLKNENIHFSIVGGKQQAADDVAAAKANGANVDYSPWLPFKELPDAMRNADLNLAGQYGNTPQARRVVSGKTYQMLACAAPSLIGGSEVTERLFTDGKDALLVPQADTQAMTEKILWAYNHPKELQAIGKQGYELYERDFSNSAIAKILDDVLQKVTR
jgi:glycosyltransferase involved in cell wall biosynthesis